MLVLSFLVAIVLFILAFVFLFKKDEREYSGYLTVGALGTLLLTVILLVSCAFIGGTNYETVEIKNYTYETNAYEFKLNGKEYYISSYITYEPKDVDLEEGLYVDYHVVGSYERIVYCFLLDRNTEVFLNNVYVVQKAKK